MHSYSSISATTLLIFLISLLLIWTSCKNDDDFNPAHTDFRFSHDTVLFDTIFTTLGSTTKRFKVINKTSSPVLFDKIELGGGSSSSYRINIDGLPATSIKNYQLNGRDSMYIFVDVTIDPNDENLPFIVTDSILFTSSGKTGKVRLVAWGQNANFYTNQIVCDEVWTKGKPYVIFDSILVPFGCKLEIEAGTQIHSHYMSGIFIGGTMEVKGTIEEPVVFRGDRLEELYNNRPGQWLGIRFIPGSSNNRIHNAIIKNATIGVQVDSLPLDTTIPNLFIENTIIENMTLAGLLGYTSHIVTVNSLINNCGMFLFLGELGGSYRFYHTTFGNYSFTFSRRDPSVVLSNSDYQISGGITKSNDLYAEFVNSIIWGNLDNELAFNTSGSGSFNLGISNTLIRTTIEGLDVNQNIINKDPLFEDPHDYNYRLKEGSPAIDAGIPISGIITDIEGNNRSGTPDLGAYESIP